ncbi:prephenate dehydratase [Shewanella sp. NIFS-20-20]|uniref:prephenate dehydratase n=1 Tax=Shewanella sp. NIFS-20-20 TaxID=2853806 RepID=UPI001C47ABC4|nr:prephenate dehydratase [Shewanella sp. NIFS-20-20]MBV7314210.1 prephenate dehydratase [Shewanella sp. NIFS-20-20]
MDKPQPLDNLRIAISSLDEDLLKLLAQRRQLSIEVARSKAVDIRPIRDIEREKQLLSRLVAQGREQGLDSHFVINLYQAIIEDSVLNQQAYLQNIANPQDKKQQYCIAYLGARGSYSHIAASRYCQRRQMSMLELGCQNFDDIISSVEKGHADYGFLPIENTSSGSINEVYDLLQHTRLSIIGEITIEVGHCLLAKPGSQLTNITQLCAHPQPISQCSQYLQQHSHWQLQYCASSAEAMKIVLDNPSDTIAAIGSAEGGELYGLEVIGSGLANQSINQSRFIVVGRKPVSVPSQLPAKTTLIMATGHKPGALVDALLVLKQHQLNMAKLESRPIAGTPWEEMFYLDIEANLADANLIAALKELEKQTRYIKVLGCYPIETVKPAELTQQQLLIEPPSSKEEPAADSSNSRSSLSYKADCSSIQLAGHALGDEHKLAMAMVSQVPQQGWRSSLQALKNSGFSAIILAKEIWPQCQMEVIHPICQQLGMALIIEVTQVQPQLPAWIDAIYLPGQQMNNPALIRQMGQQKRPVLLEKDPSSDIKAWLAAADKLLEQGNQQLALIEAGMQDYQGNSRADLEAISQLINVSHLPVIHRSRSDSLHAKTNIMAAKNLGAEAVILSASLPTETLTHLVAHFIHDKQG